MSTGLPVAQRLRASLETWFQRLWFEPAPGFSRSLLIFLLTPLSLLTGRIAAAKRRRINQQRDHDRQSVSPPSPTVLIIGNLVAGGAGKTPLTIALAGLLKQNGYQVGLICRGGPAGAVATFRIGPQAMRETGADQIGDEAQLLARATGLPVVMGHQRAEALAELTRHAPSLDIVISDDGLQHDRLRRDIELIMLDRRGLGNGRLLPAGPLREPAGALETADAIILNTGWQRDEAPPPVPSRVPVFKSALSVRDLISLDDWSAGHDQSQSATNERLTVDSACQRFNGQTVAAVAGIAQPESFFELLESYGLNIRRYAPGDHASFSAEWLDGLVEPAIILTEKDAVKCDRNSRGRIYVLRICANPDPAFFSWIVARLPARSNHQTTGSSNHGPTYS